MGIEADLSFEEHLNFLQKTKRLNLKGRC